MGKTASSLYQTVSALRAARRRDDDAVRKRPINKSPNKDHGVVKRADHDATSLHFTVCYAVFVRGRFAFRVGGVVFI